MTISPGAQDILVRAFKTFLQSFIAFAGLLFATDSSGATSFSTPGLYAALGSAGAATVSVLMNSAKAGWNARLSAQQAAVAATVEAAIQNKLDYYATNPGALQTDLTAAFERANAAAAAPAATPAVATVQDMPVDPVPATAVDDTAAEAAAAAAAAPLGN